MSAPDKVLELVEIFNRNQDAYLSGVYSEVQVRLEFIDPFFKDEGGTAKPALVQASALGGRESPLGSEGI